MARSGDPEFAVSADATSSETLLAGLSEFGLAGLTAANYLVEQLSLEEHGHVDVEQFPAITPFEAGTPRHHTRLFSREDSDVTVLVGELFVPPGVARQFSDAVLEWAGEADVGEIVLLSGVPVAHGPDEHRPFYVASPDYQAAHDLEAADVRPMTGGFLDGVNGAVMHRGIDSELRTCLLTTPAHGQAPDVEAALRLLRAVNAVYDLDVDTGPLEGFAAELRQRYEELAEHMAKQEQETRVPEDRMYM